MTQTPLSQDTINEGLETYKLTATNTGGTSTDGTGGIIDDGTGSSDWASSVRIWTATANRLLVVMRKSQYETMVVTYRDNVNRDLS